MPNARAVIRGNVFRNEEIEDLCDCAVLGVVQRLLVKPLPIGHQLVILGDLVPRSRQAGAGHILADTGFVAIKELNVHAGGLLSLLDPNDLYPLRGHIRPLSINPLISDNEVVHTRHSGDDTPSPDRASLAGEADIPRHRVTGSYASLAGKPRPAHLDDKARAFTILGACGWVCL